MKKGFFLCLMATLIAVVPVAIEVLPQDNGYALKAYGNEAIEDTAACYLGVEATLSKLPSSHLENLDTIILSFKDRDERGMANKHTIILNCLVSQEERLKVLIHEMGHVVYKNLNEDEKLSFDSISWENGSLGYEFVSVYSQVDSDEDFAESYLAYVEFGESFRSLREWNEALDAKYAFLYGQFDQKEYLGETNALASFYKRAFDLTKS